MIRPLYPTDLLSYLFLSREELPNQAITRNSLLRKSPFSPVVFLEHWLHLRGRRHTLVSVEGGRPSSVVSVKRCAAPTVWQIDYLKADDEVRCIALLDRLSAVAAEWGVRKLFLRLPATTPLADGARRACFSCYTKDYLYRHVDEPRRSITAPPEPYQVRTRDRSDEHGLFKLYIAAVPLPVRTAEGMTLEEWQGSREQGSWLDERREFVLQGRGSLAGWLQITATKGKGCFNIVSHQLGEDGLGWLVNYALMFLDGKSPIYCVVPTFQGQLTGILESNGFEQVTECDTMLKEVALRVREAQAIPIRA
jgi:hypothetical protein